MQSFHSAPPLPHTLLEQSTSRKACGCWRRRQKFEILTALKTGGISRSWHQLNSTTPNKIPRNLWVTNTEIRHPIVPNRQRSSITVLPRAKNAFCEFPNHDLTCARRMTVQRAATAIVYHRGRPKDIYTTAYLVRNC